VIGVEHVDFISVPTRDAEQAQRFYGETIGMQAERETPFGAEFRAGQVTLEVWMPESAGMPFEANHAGFALRVPDVPAARRSLEEAGVEFLGETIDTGVCHMAPFRDPDGNTLVLHRRHAPV
jgi:predicted enzyme related to lactoylglutathione lyase